MEIKSLYIIFKDSGVCLYHKDFKEPLFDPHLISSFISAMTQFFEQSKQTLESAARAFEGRDYKIIVEFGEWTVGALVVSEDRELMREKLRNIIVAFENQFSILRYVDMDLAVYSRFEPSVMNEFILEQVTPDTIVRKKLRWEDLTMHPDVRWFLEGIPERCSVEEAAETLGIPVELAIARAAEAVWEKAVVTIQPIRADDIYQAHAIERVLSDYRDISAETRRALAELDGETTVAIAAKRAQVSDYKRFMEEIAILAQRKAIEKVPPAQATLILQASVLQTLLDAGSKIIGIVNARKLFFSTKKELTRLYPWLSFVDLEDGVDVEVRSSLITASVKGTVSPSLLYDGFRTFMQDIVQGIERFIGKNPTRSIVERIKTIIERQFPNRSVEVEWEQIIAPEIKRGKPLIKRVPEVPSVTDSGTYH
ncbi:MAG: hypothetical protein K9W43_06215 [Candidatus Thorarchaeota archaeon]|nr:hypothetical protein [Candidatus Thorarchaeota archaeon]